MKMRIGSAWLNYKKAVVHPGAGDTQVDQTRKAFYAGALSAFTTVTGLAAALPENEACAVLSEMETELNAFLGDLLTKIRPSN
jgi:hypothetical protein